MPNVAISESWETDRLTRSKKLTRTPMPSSHAMRQRRHGRPAGRSEFRCGAEAWSANRLLAVICLRPRCRGSDCRRESSLHHVVLKRADGVDSDANFVCGRQGEIVRRDDAGSGHQECAAREIVFAEEVGGQVGGLALQLRKRGAARKNSAAAAQIFDPDGRGWGKRITVDKNARPQRETAVVDLGLGKEKGIL